MRPPYGPPKLLLFKTEGTQVLLLASGAQEDSETL